MVESENRPIGYLAGAKLGKPPGAGRYRDEGRPPREPNRAKRVTPASLSHACRRRRLSPGIFYRTARPTSPYKTSFHERNKRGAIRPRYYIQVYFTISFISGSRVQFRNFIFELLQKGDAASKSRICENYSKYDDVIKIFFVFVDI